MTWETVDRSLNTTILTGQSASDRGIDLSNDNVIHNIERVVNGRAIRDDEVMKNVQ